MNVVFFEPSRAFDHRLTGYVVLGVAAILLAAPVVIAVLPGKGRGSDALRRELWLRYFSWLVLVPLMLLPILLGPGVTVLAVTLLSLVCYSEFARATGLFREYLVSAVVAAGILLLAFAALDRWYNLFMALGSIVVLLIAMISILPDRPKGYIQRVALGVFAFLLFGFGLGHLSYLTADRDYRPIMLLILVGVQLNDIFAFICGKLLGRRKLAPHTSPGKTVAGSLGALVLTTALCAGCGHLVFAESVLDTPLRLIVLGLLISITGQFGDLMLSSIKRDVGIKDMGATIPGHGGVLDRANSLLIAAPAVFHYIAYFNGIGADGPSRVITGG